MSPAPKLDLHQSQSLVMTPQLQQAIKLLQLSTVDLAAYIEQEIQENPLLDRDEGDKPERGDQAEAGARLRQNEDSASSREASEGGEANSVDFLENGPSSFSDEAAAPLDTDYENHWSSNSPLDTLEAPETAKMWGRGGQNGFTDFESNFEQNIKGETTLREHLLGQVALEMEDPIHQAIGRYLIDLIDETGYFSTDLSDVAAALGCSLSLIEDSIECLRQFDPPGVFARDLADCLALQLRERNRLDPAMQIVLDHLDLLARHNWSKLRRLCGVEQEDLDDMVAEIRGLNPKPALVFDPSPVQSVIPDVFMRPHPKGGWSIELNQDTLPRILINKSYQARLNGKTGSRKERDYITEHLATAHWLVKSLHQRAETILKVSTELVHQQEAFFTQGVEYLKPLILRDIAEAIGMHESTVSRVTANKYIATPRGVFELKYFFTAAIQGCYGGEVHSAESVRYKIRKLIDDEDPDHILSDDRLVELLRQDGVDIARRTVAKYRESMRIPSSIQRRREKMTGY